MVGVLQQYCCVLMVTVALVSASSVNKIDKLVKKTLLRSKRMVTSECPSRMALWPGIQPALCCPCSKCPEDHLYTGHYNYADDCWGEDEEYSCYSEYTECLDIIKAWEIFWTTTTTTTTSIIPPSTTPNNITTVAIAPTTSTTTEAPTLLQVVTTKEGNNLALYAIVGILSLLCILAFLWLLRRKYKNKYQDLKKYLRTVCAGNKPDSTHTPLRKTDLDRQDTVEEMQESYSSPGVKMLESPPDDKRHIVNSKRTVYPVQATPFEDSKGDLNETVTTSFPSTVPNKNPGPESNPEWLPPPRYPPPLHTPDPTNQTTPPNIYVNGGQAFIAFASGTGNVHYVNNNYNQTPPPNTLPDEDTSTNAQSFNPSSFPNSSPCPTERLHQEPVSERPTHIMHNNVDKTGHPSDAESNFAPSCTSRLHIRRTRNPTENESIATDSSTKAHALLTDYSDASKAPLRLNCQIQNMRRANDMNDHISGGQDSSLSTPVQCMEESNGSLNLDLYSPSNTLIYPPIDVHYKS
uniref:Uncharacterized LOC100181622 n=1 Tax=Ciona intestinalis TaxID=7719 RepID=F6QP72_CIOIN|nr:uncharacterized protein LOC100181622 isoform X2 [Ciona intestinalis]|eukprot:XP_002124991.1 uncharacterized protein LOC100181622 isoform X2 [Ciona intestinalis]